MFSEKNLSQQGSLEGEKIKDFESLFDNLVQDFELRINKLDDEIKEFAENNCKEIINAFLELKDGLKERLLKVKAKNLELIPQALEELNELFNVLTEILEDNFEDYKVRNRFDEETEKLIYTNLEKRDGGERVELQFNFIPTKNGQARVGISYRNVSEKQFYSIRIDKDEEREVIFIDLDTPTINKIFSGIKDGEKGEGHHFKSEALTNFIETEKFTQLVQVFKEILSQTSEQEHFDIQDLINKYNSK